MSIPISQVVEKSYDYIIVGGGTAGLVVATRLSANPAVSVLVIEAGSIHEGNPKIDVPGQFGSQLGIEKYDWCFQTVPQKHVDEKQIFWNRGKGLGGCSAINFQGWISQHSEDMNAIEALGNPGWSWNSFSKYLHRVTEAVDVIVPRRLEVYDELFSETLSNMGVKKNPDPYRGDNTGPFIAKANINPKNYTRSYAASTYYASAKHRSNLTVITNALVTRVLFSNDSVVDLVATGAEFIYDGSTYIAKCNKEVVISASTIKSPHILELSGIGRKDVLDKIGVEVKVDLPGVGENVQEHLLFTTTYEIRSDTQLETLDLMRNPEYAAERLKFNAEGKGEPSVHVTSVAYIPWPLVNPETMPGIIKNVDDKVQEMRKSGKLPPGLVEQYDLQLKLLKDPAVPDFEIVIFPGYYASKVPYESHKTYLTFMFIANHTFSRGSIHAKSSDPKEYPEIDPHYFDMDYDMELLVQHVHLARRMINQEPLKSSIDRELDPGPDVVTNAQIREYIKKCVGTAWHAVGSCSMLPLEKNGVVSPELIVYGTKNLRVADISVIPLHISAHTQATAYAIGEKVADLIMGK